MICRPGERPFGIQFADRRPSWYYAHHRLLDFRGTPNGVHDARKLCQKSVTGIFDDPTRVLLDFGLNQIHDDGLLSPYACLPGRSP